MVELAPDFDEFFRSLTAHHVEFLVVGAYALAYHGAPRYTGNKRAAGSFKDLADLEALGA